MKKLFLTLLMFTATSNVFSQYCKDSLINDFVSKWIGKPYRFGGTDQRGIDCSALVQRFYKTIYGAEIPRTCFYQFKHMVQVMRNDLRPGDAVFFNSRYSPSGWHVGIYIGNDQFFHAANFREGVKISCIEDDRYIKAYKGAARVF